MGFGDFMVISMVISEFHGDFHGGFHGDFNGYCTISNLGVSENGLSYLPNGNLNLENDDERADFRVFYFQTKPYRRFGRFF